MPRVRIGRITLTAPWFHVLSMACSCAIPAAADESLRVATFEVDATPAVGSPITYTPVRSIVDPLKCRGLVLLGSGGPIVLCAVDWIGIGNGGQEIWRRALAEAAGTSPDRVAVHTLHQHDAPWCDFTTESMLADRGLTANRIDLVFARATIRHAAEAIRNAVKDAQRVSHLGIGKARVKKVASNRRILGPDGKVKVVRFSSSRIPEAIAAPEGVIDPFVQLLVFWDGNRPIASLTYYATHPQSYYGDGDVSSDFVGIARAIRDSELPDVKHIHFNGAGGNVAAGKYNDGSPERRPILAGRLADGMRAAWEAQKKTPLAASNVKWQIHKAKLPVARHLDAKQLRATLDDSNKSNRNRANAAAKLAWISRAVDGSVELDISCLRIGPARVLHMPGELFVEYQLAAQEMQPDQTVCMAAYGDYGPWYIGTEVAYGEGGYETSPGASLVAPQVEAELMSAMQELLD